MTRLEQIKLNEWIAKNVMDLDFNGFHWCLKSDPKICVKLGGDCPDYSDDPAQAMLVIEKCGLRLSGTTIKIRLLCGNLSWIVSSTVCDACGNAESLPLAIAKFARKLYDKAEET